MRMRIEDDDGGSANSDEDHNGANTKPRGHHQSSRSPQHAHFPPRPRKSAWRSDITDVIWTHPALHLHYKVASSEATAGRTFFPPTCVLPSY